MHEFPQDKEYGDLAPGVRGKAHVLPPDSGSPRCLNCGYDLAGLPEGRCPECGKAWSFAQMRAHVEARQAAKAARKRFAALGLAILAGSGSICMVGSPWSLVLIVGTWGAFVPMIIHAVRNLRSASAQHMYGFTALMLVTAMHVMVLMGPGYVLIAFLAALALVLGFFVCHTLWGTLTLVLAAIALPLLAQGCFMVAHGSNRIAKGHHWSNIDDPFVFSGALKGPVGLRVNALTSRQAVRMGGFFMLVGAAAAGASVVCLPPAIRAQRRKRASRVPST